MPTVSRTSFRAASGYVHEFSGGQRQRIGIARALAVNPEFIVCDEPISALDVSIQSQVINLLKELQEKLGLTYMFIAHDLNIVKYISDRIAVMYLGQIVELCDTDTMFENTMHPYSIALLSAVPQVNVDAKVNRILLKGDVPSPMNPKPGCRFAPRCPYADEECFKSNPLLTDDGRGHFAACHHI